MRNTHRWLFLILLIAPLDAVAQKGAISVDPKRLVLDPNNRSGSFVVMHTGPDTLLYELSVVDTKMTSDGALDVDTSSTDTLSAKKFLRFHPHEVLLGPNESQVIRVQILKPTDLPVGEYRAHLMIKPVPPPVPIEHVSDTETRIAMKVTVFLGSAVPVFFRNGTTPSDAFLSDLHKTQDTSNHTQMLSVRLHRTGQESIYGKFIATHIAPDGKETPIGIASGYGVYAGLGYRDISFPIYPNGADLEHGRILVRFETMNGDQKEKQLAKAELSM